MKSHIESIPAEVVAYRASPSNVYTVHLPTFTVTTNWLFAIVLVGCLMPLYFCCLAHCSSSRKGKARKKRLIRKEWHDDGRGEAYRRPPPPNAPLEEDDDGGGGGGGQRYRSHHEAVDYPSVDYPSPSSPVYHSPANWGVQEGRGDRGVCSVCPP